MKKIILSLVLLFFVNGIYAAALTPLTNAEKENINKSNPVFNRYLVGTRMQDLENRFSNTAISEGVGYTTNLAIAEYDFSTDYETFTFASTAVNDTPTNTITKLSHGLISGDVLDFSSDSTLFEIADLLIDADSIFYAIKVDNNNFQLASSRANAIAGTELSITAAGTATLITAHINRVGSVDLGIDLPDNAIVLGSYIEPTTSTAGGSVALGLNTTVDVYASAPLTGGTMVKGLQSTGATPTITKMVAETPLLATFSAKMTAGVFRVYLTYVIGE